MYSNTKFDKKTYHNYQLDNGLDVLIIIDKKIRSEGASMSINAGALQDKKLKGLAHLAEHVLFLSTKKFPDPLYFINYLSKFHGKFNGFTGLNRTAFYYKVHKEHFSKSLSIFSRFFIDPLFLEESIIKEINIVNSEFLRNCQSNSMRKEFILRSLSNQDSPYHIFRTGNLFFNLKQGTLKHY